MNILARPWAFLLILILLLPGYLLAQQATPTAPAQAEEIATDGDTEIHVKNAELSAILRIFSKKTKRNYILDERVKGKVSIYLPGKVSSDEAIRILDSVLALKGFSAVPISENLWKIIPSKEAKQSTIPTFTEDIEGIPSAQIITRLVRLDYINAEDAKQLLTPLISGDGLLNAYTGTNSLMIIDSEDNIARLMKIIESVDVPFSDQEMTIIPIKFADAVDVAEKLGQILGIGTTVTGSSSQQNPQSDIDAIRARIRESLSGQSNVNMPRFTPQAVAASSGPTSTTVGTRFKEPKIIADERTNAIIIVADDSTTSKIRALVDQLDSKFDLSGRRFYVYRCKYASAEDLAQVLTGIAGGESSSSTGTRSGSTAGGLGGDMFGTSSRSGGLSGSRSGTGMSGSQQRLSRQQRSPGESRLDRDRKSPTGAVSLGEDISITADPATNSLIINAGKSDYFKLRELLRKLDVKPKQVLVEAMLLEVGVDDSQQMSTEFLTSAGTDSGGVFAQSDFGGNLEQLFSDPTKLSSFSVAAASSGTLTLPGEITIPTQSILLNAAKANTNVNVLSAPTILATDNEPAEIVVGQNVPFVSSTSTNETNLNNTFNQVERQDVGITLRLTPQISSGDSVRLQLFTEVSNIVASTVGSALGPTTTIRTSETSVITKDGQMVVIGGLMSDDITESDSGVPYLKDIPVLGHMFRNNSDARRRTNLLIFITPRVVRDQFDARDTTISRRNRLEYQIEKDEVYPNREEILRNPSIDKVNEVDVESKEVGTILPPSDTAEELEKLEISESAPIRLKIAPKFSEKKTDKLKSPLAPKSLALLKLEGQGSEGLPFELSNGKFLALQLPEGNTIAQDFFSPGHNYTYEVAPEKLLKFKAVYVGDSQPELEKLSGKLPPEYHILSPHEILNLGLGPWRKSS